MGSGGMTCSVQHLAQNRATSLLGPCTLLSSDQGFLWNVTLRIVVPSVFTSYSTTVFTVVTSDSLWG
jgi:hypothetical protein